MIFIVPALPTPVTTGSVSPVSLAEASRFWLQLGLVSFGGPAGQIALLQGELVERRHWLSERRFLHALNYCILLPGPEAMQLATYLGWLMHGVPGGLIAGGLFIIPSVVVLTALASVYALWGQLPLLASVFAVLKPAVLAIVLMAAWRIGRRSLHTPLLVALAIAGFVALAAFKFPYPLVVITAGLIGLGAARWRPNLLVASKPHGAGSSDSQQDRPGALHDDDSASPDHARFSKPRLAVTLLAKALLQHLPRLHEGPAFLPLWEAILAALQRAVKVRFLPRRNSAHSEVPVAGCDVGRHLRPPLHTCDSELSIRFAPSRSNPTQRTASSANTSCAVP